MATTIRRVTSEDLSAVHALVRELAEYEKGLHRVTTTPESYARDYKEGVFDAFVAEVDDEIVGMALFYMNFSTWRGKMLYLEDFIVKETMRGQGIGKLLFEEFLAEAQRLGCTMAKWQVLDWNEPGINFYKKYDVVFDKEWIDCKVYFS